MDHRAELLTQVRAGEARLVALARALIAQPSPNPPGDTTALVTEIERLLAPLESAEVTRHTAEPPIANLVARLTGRGPGRRLVFNGHLDTYPVGDPAAWSVDPLAGEIRDGRLYGRGAGDMKGGLAAALFAFELMARHRDAWAGELVLTFAGDEEVMGTRGTQYLLETLAHARGDAMICGDGGSPRVLRFGEKGMVWLALEARGRAAHGAHVHLGESAIERLTEALARLASLRQLSVAAPPRVARAIAEAALVSEAISGAGESQVLQAVTVNVGLISGGQAMNLVADRAQASVDIRLPAGTNLAQIEAEVASRIGGLEGVTYRVVTSCEPTWSDPDHEIMRLAQANGEAALGERPVINMRVGGSDARLYREAGVPALVCGLTPHNMGAPDEYLTLDDLKAVAEIHAMTAFDYLVSGGA